EIEDRNLEGVFEQIANKLFLNEESKQTATSLLEVLKGNTPNDSADTLRLASSIAKETIDYQDKHEKLTSAKSQLEINERSLKGEIFKMNYMISDNPSQMQAIEISKRRLTNELKQVTTTLANVNRELENNELR